MSGRMASKQTDSLVAERGRITYRAHFRPPASLTIRAMRKFKLYDSGVE